MYSHKQDLQYIPTLAVQGHTFQVSRLYRVPTLKRTTAIAILHNFPPVNSERIKHFHSKLSS